VSVIRQSDKGRALLDAALAIVADIEQGYERHLGAERFATLKRLLTALVEHIDPEGSLGRD